MIKHKFFLKNKTHYYKTLGYTKRLIPRKYYVPIRKGLPAFKNVKSILI